MKHFFISYDGYNEGTKISFGNMATKEGDENYKEFQKDANSFILNSAKEHNKKVDAIHILCISNIGD